MLGLSVGDVLQVVGLGFAGFVVVVVVCVVILALLQLILPTTDMGAEEAAGRAAATDGDAVDADTVGPAPAAASDPADPRS